MKTFGFLLILLTFPVLLSRSQNPEPVRSDALRTVPNNAFGVGEYLKYRIHYGIIDAGIAELEVKGKTYRNNREVYHMVGKGRSVGMAEWFFKTRDTYQTFVDTKAIIPWEFIRDVDEGGYKINRHFKFDQYNNTARDLKQTNAKVHSIPENSQDLLSTFYYARCLNTEEMEVGDVLPVIMFLDYEPFSFQFKYMGKETIESKWGKVRCRKFMPVVQSGRVFEDKQGMMLWVTDDANKIPIRVQAELAVGSIKMDLIDFENNLHPIQFMK